MRIAEHEMSAGKPVQFLSPRVLKLARVFVCLLAAFAYPHSAVGQTPTPEFMPLDAAKPAIEKLGTTDGHGLTPAISSHDWLAWLQRSDAQVRERLDVGEEDSLTNLLRFGVTYTKEYRIDDEYLLRYGQSSLVDSFARNRANDLIKALAAPNRNQGFQEMRAFVESKGFSVNSPAGQKKVKAYLLANLARMQKEFLQAQSESKSDPNKSFQHRGISLDSNLWPDYDLDLALQALLKAKMLRPAQVERVAIVGPGLDFVNKQEGVDYYPPQTTQPFAVFDSLLRLELAKPDKLEIFTLDISPRVNLHLETANKNAALGQSYTIQLPWYADGRWSDEFRKNFTQYWRALGSQIGDPVAAIPVPSESPGFETRAVKIHPSIVRRIKPIDTNIVYQQLSLPPSERFNLIIGTNIFIYYGRFEQSLARANIAAALKPGGFLLSNQQLEDAVPSGLEQVMVIDVPMTGPPVIADHIYCYRLKP
jgi:hypothetical protein